MCGSMVRLGTSTSGRPPRNCHAPNMKTTPTRLRACYDDVSSLLYSGAVALDVPLMRPRESSSPVEAPLPLPATAWPMAPERKGAIA